MAFSPIDFYDARTGGHAGERVPLEDRERVAIELARPLLGQNAGAALDIGCGSGEFLTAFDEAAGLARRGWRLVGIDFSDYQVGRASRRPYEFRQCNVEEGIPYDDASFDIVFCGELIEHLYDPDSFLEVCHRVLKPGGHLIVTTPNLHAWYNRLLFIVGIQPVFYETSTRSTSVGAGPLRRLKKGTTPVGHVRIFNQRALLDLLRSQGFSPVATRGATFLAVPRPAQRIDQLFTRRPSWASNLVVLSERSATVGS